MKFVLGIYSLFITLFYIAFFTFAGDFINGVYTTPYLVFSFLFLMLAFFLDLRENSRAEKRGMTYFITLAYLNVPMVVLAFFVPLMNGNRTIDEILIYQVPLTIGMFIGLFVTIPIIGYVMGTLIDFLRYTQKRMSLIKKPNP
jgi:hypothetical protein